MVTIKDVAAKSGFSVATVSAVINGKTIVSPRSKEIILQTINELGYRPNAVARNLKKSKSPSIAILVRAVTNPLYLQVVLGLEEMAWKHNYEILFCSIGPNLEREDKYIDNLIERRVGGVVIATSTLIRQKGLDKLHMHNIPYVFVNRKPDRLEEHECYIGLDNVNASKMIVNHLNELGVRDIAYLSGPQEFSTFKERMSGFRDAMKSNGIPLQNDRIFETDFTKECGYQVIKELIVSGNLPEAVLCSSDLLASGAYLAFKEENIRIPDDILLTGIDNSDLAELMDLTTIDPHAKEMGRRAGHILVDIISDSSNELKKEILLQPQLVVRNSSKK
ncbi:LacI family DNA-binding transcriptional regulator [Alkalihalobacillus sp. BA299]|uniref:LacI family DNA-binding transcriptional regulator n=1 Tax=Alkalihalobacillus sp. BA299 TaxID=2815938 RepID=UPI001ADC1213|nr:LacI family DNA-binding transcriptional regulator [Alkalihalobacillus sp. BA299]